MQWVALRAALHKLFGEHGMADSSRVQLPMSGRMQVCPSRCCGGPLVSMTPAQPTATRWHQHQLSACPSQAVWVMQQQRRQQSEQLNQGLAAMTWGCRICRDLHTASKAGPQHQVGSLARLGVFFVPPTPQSEPLTQTSLLHFKSSSLIKRLMRLFFIAGRVHDATPGPMDYCPDPSVLLPSAPCYSIASRPAASSAPAACHSDSPGPGDYDVTRQPGSLCREGPAWTMGSKAAAVAANGCDSSGDCCEPHPGHSG